MTERASTEQAIDALVAGTISLEEAAQGLDDGLGCLPVFARHLEARLDIDALERLEDLLKVVLLRRFRAPVDGESGRAIAEFQRRAGLLLKYKSYAVKCAHPLGYSVFLQKPGQGFSFQRHTEHKVEVFHILEAPPGGYVFLCTHEEWEQAYEEDAFTAWLSGGEDERYECFRHYPEPGDVVVIDELNVVHTIVGCVLEEFATVSTDMVDRLHDQNAGAPIPDRFTREYAREQLRAIEYPATSALVEDRAGGRRLPSLPRTPVEGGRVRVLADTFVAARHYEIDPGARGPLLQDQARATAIYVTGGAGAFVIADAGELGDAREPAPIEVETGSVLTIAPGLHYRPVSTGDSPLAFSEHHIAAEVAFAPVAELAG